MKDNLNQLSNLLAQKYFKRFLICDSYVVAWTNVSEKIAVALWKKEFIDLKLRIVPKEPLEGGWTQNYWNQLWDSGQKLTTRIRQS